MKRWAKWLSRGVLVLVLAALVAVLMLYLDGAFTHKVATVQPPAGSAPAEAANLVEARWVDVPTWEQAPGTIQPLHQIALASKVREPEKVAEVHVVAGQQVHKGQPTGRPF